MVVTVTGVGVIHVELVVICTKFAMIGAVFCATVKTVFMGGSVRSCHFTVLATVLGMVAGMADGGGVDVVVGESRGERHAERENGGYQ